jgi:hypothetical protein
MSEKHHPVGPTGEEIKRIKMLNLYRNEIKDAAFLCSKEELLEAIEQARSELIQAEAAHQAVRTDNNIDKKTKDEKEMAYLKAQEKFSVLQRAKVKRGIS